MNNDFLERAKKSGKSMQSVSNALIMLVIAISVINVLFISGISGSIAYKAAALEEENRPADIMVTKIVYPGCESCYDIGQAMDQISSLEVKVTEERELSWDSPEARSLIEQYGIGVLPTAVITGETGKPSIEPSWEKIGDVRGDGTVIFNKQALPYYDTGRQEVMGLVRAASIVDSSCEKCIKMEGMISSFAQAGVAISEQSTPEYDSPEAAELIGELGIVRIPALVISDNIAEYDGMSQVLDQLGAVRRNGSYVLEAPLPPYRNLETGSIDGLVKLVNIVDSSCADCYDVSLHKSILQRFGVTLAGEATYEINSTEGKALVKKYGITEVPTILLSPETSYYSSLSNVWSQVGSVEGDGWYIFRDLSQLGDVVYRNL